MSPRFLSLALAGLVLAGPASAQVGPRPPGPGAVPSVQPDYGLNLMQTLLLDVFRRAPLRKDPDPAYRPGQDDWARLAEAIGFHEGMDLRDAAYVDEVQRRFAVFLRTAGPLYPSEIEKVALHILVLVAAEEMIRNPENTELVLRRAAFLAKVRHGLEVDPPIRPFMDFVPELDGPPPQPNGLLALPGDVETGFLGN